MRLLAFSDLHRDLDQAATLVEMSADADVVIGAGDFASVHEGLEETIAALAAISTPTILVPGNNETIEALREAASDWEAATVLHGEAAKIEGTEFFGLGAGIPVTPWDWSFDLDDDGRRRDDRRLPARARSSSSTRRRRATATRTPAATTSAARRCSRAIEEKAPRLRGLRPHPRVLGLREPDRRDAAPQPRPQGHLARRLGVTRRVPAGVLRT